MEEQSLTEYLAEHSTPTADGDRTPRPWYDRYGDCIDFQTEPVAVVADRIDNYLTIYRAADTNNAIGFQLKDVTALMKKNDSQLGVVWTTKDNRLVSITSLLLTALETESPWTMKKRSGYEQALKNLASGDEVMLTS